MQFFTFFPPTASYKIRRSVPKDKPLKARIALVKNFYFFLKVIKIGGANFTGSLGFPVTSSEAVVLKRRVRGWFININICVLLIFGFLKFQFLVKCVRC